MTVPTNKLGYNFPSLQIRDKDFDSKKTARAMATILQSIRKFFIEVINAINAIYAGVELPTYTVATVPTASAYTRRMIYISDEAGGAVPAFSDGTNWRRVTDRAVVS